MFNNEINGFGSIMEDLDVSIEEWATTFKGLEGTNIGDT